MRRICLVLLALAAFAAVAPPATAGILGSAEAFTVLGGSATVTNTGTTTITGDLGLSTGASITGFSAPPANTLVQGPGSTGLISDAPGLVSGTIYISHAVAQLAQLDVTKASIGLAAMTPDFDLTGQDLGGLTLTPGVYNFDTTAQLTGTLTLDAMGTDYAYWVFQIGSSLTTASASSVNIINAGPLGGTFDGLFWQIHDSATLGTTTAFEGNILAGASITLNTGATIHNGRALAKVAVTMDSNTLSQFSPAPNNGTMSGGLEFDLNGNVVPVTAPAAVPEPGSFVLIASGLAGLICLRKRVRSAV